MKKDAYYFPHFSNARTDRRLKRVRKQLGIEGYGIYFMILETLRDQTEFRYPTEDIDLLADEFGTSEEKARAVVINFGLFDVDENEEFFSPKMLEYMTPYLENKERKRIGGIKGNLLKYKKITKEKLETMNDSEIMEYDKLVKNGKFSHSDSESDSDTDRLSSQSKVKESKVNKSKEKESKSNNIYSVSNLEQRFENFRETVLTYREQYSDDMLKAFFEYWTEKNERGYKMKFEKQETFDISKRLKRWNDNDFGKSTTGGYCLASI